MTCSPSESVRPCGFQSRIGRPVTSHDQGPDSHGCGLDRPLWKRSHSACSCHSELHSHLHSWLHCQLHRQLHS